MRAKGAGNDHSGVDHTFSHRVVGRFPRRRGLSSSSGSYRPDTSHRTAPDIGHHRRRARAPTQTRGCPQYRGADSGEVIDLRHPTVDAPPLHLGTPQGATGETVTTPSQMDRSEPFPDGPDADIIDLTGRVSVLVPIHNLQFVRGIGPEANRLLRSYRVRSLPDLTELGTDDIAKIGAHERGPSAKQIRNKLQPRAQQMLDAAGQYNIAEPPDNRELRRVQGIGTIMMRWLETQGITSLEELAALDKAQTQDLDAELADYPGRIREQRWVKQARGLLVPT